MATFNFEKLTVNAPRQIAITSQTAGKVNLKSKILEVRSTVKVLLTYNEKYYVGFVQVCTANSRVNHYRPNVEQKWEFSHPVVSDAGASNERPWYGTRNAPTHGSLIPALPLAAFNTPTANDNQQLSRYVNGRLANVIVPRNA
jgi:hypothetical protein